MGKLCNLEEIPQLEKPDIKAFIWLEMLVYEGHIWISNHDITIGDEVSLSRHFRQSNELRTLAEVRAGALKPGQETQGLPGEINKGVSA